MQYVSVSLDLRSPGCHYMPMKKSTAIKKAGNAYRLAQILGIKRQSVHKWGENIPTLREYQLKVERPDWFKKEKA